VFWLAALATPLPVAAPLWVTGWLLDLPDTFGAFIGDLVRWRKAG
jgi:hypothetical protein